ncbi:hypothetical protein E2C01_074920 [Portunus trituberculatus]|uniref:Uncharacterized protein n=1 Tax=Portunus trituberculatus TaxID=210409 RepID=A0A5B7I998_PORTR|nr:hypothetical protein [Portunus trituberculatus]
MEEEEEEEEKEKKGEYEEEKEVEDEEQEGKDGEFGRIWRTLQPPVRLGMLRLLSENLYAI